MAAQPYAFAKPVSKRPAATAQVEKFWAFYTEKYGYLLSENTQFTLDCRTNKIFLVPTDA